MARVAMPQQWVVALRKRITAAKRQPARSTREQAPSPVARERLNPHGWRGIHAPSRHAHCRQSMPRTASHMEFLTVSGGARHICSFVARNGTRSSLLTMRQASQAPSAFPIGIAYLRRTLGVSQCRPSRGAPTRVGVRSRDLHLHRAHVMHGSLVR